MSRRYPLAPLLEAAGLTESGLTRRAGLSGSTLKKAREDGFTADAADRYAVRCGLLPGEVWPEWWDEAVDWKDPNTRRCQAHGCEVEFPITNPRRRYCSKTCKRRVEGKKYQAKKYATDPAFRAKKIARRADFYKQTAEYEKARERRRYRENRQAALARSQTYYKNNAESLREKARERRKAAASSENSQGARGEVAA